MLSIQLEYDSYSLGKIATGCFVPANTGVCEASGLRLQMFPMPASIPI